MKSELEFIPSNLQGVFYFFSKAGVLQKKSKKKLQEYFLT